MKTPGYKVKIGIVGCGAIGSRMAESIQSEEFNKDCRITGLYDIDAEKMRLLQKKLKLRNIAVNSLDKLIQRCDCMVEATSADDTTGLIRKALMRRKSVLAMSVGKLLNGSGLFELARKKKCYILLPSGALAGLDAVKAGALGKIKSVTLTTRKHPKGFRDNPYFQKKNIDLSAIKKETVIYEGGVEKAVRYFPRNINVAATLALALGRPNRGKIKIRIIASPNFKRNSHEVRIDGDFGKLTTRTDNLVCPDNPKTSYLAVLSGLQTLRQYCTGILVGT